MTLQLINNQLNKDNYWHDKLTQYKVFESTDVQNFDQNGYDLSLVEQAYANDANIPTRKIRDRVAIVDDWFIQRPRISGAIVNHCYLFHRKQFVGEAFEQLQVMARQQPMLFKPLKLKAKWGLDISIDYVDFDGNVLEVLHWEWDGFNIDQVNAIKSDVEDKLINVDWDDAAKQLIKRKDEWYHLGFFAQSEWKCDYFGIPQEQFKMVSWQ